MQVPSVAQTRAEEYSLTAQGLHRSFNHSPLEAQLCTELGHPLRLNSIVFSILFTHSLARRRQPQHIAGVISDINMTAYR